MLFDLNLKKEMFKIRKQIQNMQDKQDQADEELLNHVKVEENESRFIMELM